MTSAGMRSGVRLTKAIMGPNATAMSAKLTHLMHIVSIQYTEETGALSKTDIPTSGLVDVLVFMPYAMA
jgi:hypothetical protein